MSEVDFEAIRASRRAADGVDTLADGFTLKMKGPWGCVYYKDGERVLEILVETAGVGEKELKVWTESFDAWDLPDSRELDAAEKASIMDGLRRWLRSQGFAPTVD